MKRSRLWLALILIALALLLSAEKPSPKPNSRASIQPRSYNSERFTHQSGYAQTATIQPSSVAKPTAAPNKQVIYSEKSAERRQETEPIRVLPIIVDINHDWFDDLTLIGTALLVIVGAGYTLVAHRQLKAFNQQTELLTLATRIQRLTAIAADKSAEAARLALNAERLYVFVDGQQLTYNPYRRMSLASLPTFTLGASSDPTPPDEPVSTMDVQVIFNVRNHGKGVALLKAVHTELILVQGIFDDTPKKPIRASKDRSQMLKSRIVQPDQYFVHRSFGLSLPIDSWNQIKKWYVGLWVAGCVSYQDVFRRSHVSWFCFEYRPPSDSTEAPGAQLPSIEGFLTIGHEKYNRYT